MIVRIRLFKTILIASCLLGAVASSRVEGQPTLPAPNAFARLTQQELQLLLADVAEANPQVLERFKEDPGLKKAQLDNLRQLLAFASEAQRTLVRSNPQFVAELENIRAEVIAVNYDRHLHKGKAQPSFGSITPAAMTAYWGDNVGSRLTAETKAQRKAGFEKFLTAKVHFLKGDDPALKDKEPTPEEVAQARDVYAKIRIYSDEYAKNASRLPLTFRQKVDLQVKLQQAQFLAREYAEKLHNEVAATDAEIGEYLKSHPELDPATKRAKAEKVLARAKSGEDFAALANEFSEDPGNKNQQNEPQGGLYADVSRGTMLPEFELAALALTPGQIAPQVVETDFGFHIIKLERKGEAPAGTYDVRHILVATAVPDPSNPSGRPLPLKEYARKEIESEKEQKIIDRVVAANKISVPEDFVVPSPEVKPAPATPATPKRATRRPRKRT